MSNRRLSDAELVSLFAPLIIEVRARLRALAAGDDGLHWALRRKLAKELVYDERSKPMQRRSVKAKKRAEQHGLCAVCAGELPPRGAVLDRFEAMKGYTLGNTRLLCPACDTEVQASRNYA